MYRAYASPYIFLLARVAKILAIDTIEGDQALDLHFGIPPLDLLYGTDRRI